jgi:hypothetical protein
MVSPSSDDGRCFSRRSISEREVFEQIDGRSGDVTLQQMSVTLPNHMENNRPCFSAHMGTAVLKKYSCSHSELLSERASLLIDDIQTFAKAVKYVSPAATS